MHFSSLARPFWYTTTRARVCSNSGVAKKVRQQTGLIHRGAVYHYRHRVPGDLLSHYGRREIKRPLNTKDKGEAMRLAAAERTRVLVEFARVRVYRIS